MPRTPTPSTLRGRRQRLNLDPRDLGLPVAAGLPRQALLRRPKRRPPPLLGPQMLRQLIAAVWAEQSVLPAVGLLSLLEDVRDQLLVRAVRAPRRVRADLRAIDRDHPDLHQPRLLAQRQHLGKQLAERPLMPATELRDRRVIRHPHRRDQLVHNILPTRPLDPPRRAVPTRIRVQQQRDHHRRLIRRPPLTILPMSPIERRQVHLLNSAQDRPHHVIIRHPIRQIRRHQHRLPPVLR